MSSNMFPVPDTYKRRKLTADEIATSQHLQPINLPLPRAKDVSFTPFPLLSTELRLRIWEYVIIRRRLLEIEVETSDNKNEGDSSSTTTHTLNESTSGCGYTITVHGSQLYHELFGVNRESRGVALRFYRIHIPCTFHKFRKENDQTTRRQATKSLIYINPEHDILNIQTNPAVGSAIVGFFHDLRANDPQSIGLLNLALDINSMNALTSILTDFRPTVVHASFTHILTHLSHIIYIASSSFGRAIIGPLHGSPSTGVRFNHSMPITARTPTFELFPQDPRPVDPDLEHIMTTSIDPNVLRTKWEELLQRFSIRQPTPTTQRVLVAYETNSSTFEKGITTFKTAVEYLDVEEGHWLQTQQRWHMIVKRIVGKVPIEDEEELANAVRPAIGFWLFPIEAMQRKGPGPKLVFDLRGHTPELALACLS